ncbi:ABC transporter substrate-binding protein [Streptomyces xinghaiensis]|uniref:ABC transporter substrate-binding protein n=1 Tax=Streptomyces xinghaiensis TaxID=1038928 RepID=UPI0037919A63
MNCTLRRRTALRRVATATVAVALGLGLSACGGIDRAVAEDGGPVSVKVGIIPIIDVAPLYLGVEQGFFEEENLEVEMESGQGGAAIVPGVLSEQYQFGFSNTASLLLSVSKGQGLQAVAAGAATTGESGEDFGAVVVPEDSRIKDAADLEGKRVAVNTLQNINTLTINQAVRAGGGDPSTIEYVELPFPDIAPAVAAGDVDAGQVVEPFVTVAEQQGNRQVTSNFAAADPLLMVGLYFTSDRYAQQHPEVVAAFTRAMEKSLAHARRDPEKARAILDEYTDIAPEVQKNIVLPDWPEKIGIGSVKRLALLMAKDGITESPPDTAKLLP